MTSGTVMWVHMEQQKSIHLAEGAHFYTIAFSSLMETLNQLIISNDLNYIDSKSLTKSRKEIHTISMMLNSLRNSLIKT